MAIKESEILGRLKAVEVLCEKALSLAMDANIKISAAEKSTHTLYPVGVDTNSQDSLKAFEKKLKKAVGVGDEDFEEDLKNLSNNESVDDLV